MRKCFAAVLAVIILFVCVSPSSASTYLVNTKSGKFHYSDCRTIKHHNAKHFVTYNSREACVADGYIPCKVCHP